MMHVCDQAATDAVVAFQATDNPYYYDVLDRRSPQITLETEMQWENEKELGITDLTLADWFSARSDALFDVAFEPPWEEMWPLVYTPVRRVRTCRGLLFDKQ
jgi:hypothetical protein